VVLVSDEATVLARGRSLRAQGVRDGDVLGVRLRVTAPADADTVEAPLPLVPVEETDEVSHRPRRIRWAVPWVLCVVVLLIASAAAAAVLLTGRDESVRVRAPEPGVYRYRLERAGRIGERTETIQVTKGAAGGPAKLGTVRVQEDRGDVMVHEARWDGSGAFFEATTVSAQGGIGRCDWTPDLMVVPSSFRRGAEHQVVTSCTATAGERTRTVTVSGNLRVIEPASVTVAGERIDVWRVEVKLTATTLNSSVTAANPDHLVMVVVPEVLEQTETLLYSPARALVVQRVLEEKFTAMGKPPVQTRAESLLQSTRPG
jgi:hypothetical protein